MKEWVTLNWWRWQQEKPEIFTEAWIARIPPSFGPEEAKGEAKAIRASARRRSSLALVAKEFETRRVEPVVGN